MHYNKESPVNPPYQHNDLFESSHCTLLPTIKGSVSNGVKQFSQNAEVHGHQKQLLNENSLDDLQQRVLWSGAHTSRNQLLVPSQDYKMAQPDDHSNRRVVLPKAQPDDQFNRRVILPKAAKSKSQPVNSTDADHLQQVQTTHPTTSKASITRQEYEEELEFLKLKLRYMLNDIEFKQQQLDSAKASDFKLASISKQRTTNKKHILAQDDASVSLNYNMGHYSSVHPKHAVTKLLMSDTVEKQKTLKAYASGYKLYPQRNTSSSSSFVSAKSNNTVIARSNTLPIATKSNNCQTLYSWSSQAKGGTKEDTRETSSCSDIKNVHITHTGFNSTSFKHIDSSLESSQQLKNGTRTIMGITKTTNSSDLKNTSEHVKTMTNNTGFTRIVSSNPITNQHSKNGTISNVSNSSSQIKMYSNHEGTLSNGSILFASVSSSTPVPNNITQVPLELANIQHSARSSTLAIEGKIDSKSSHQDIKVGSRVVLLPTKSSLVDSLPTDTIQATFQNMSSLGVGQACHQNSSIAKNNSSIRHSLNFASSELHTPFSRHSGSQALQSNYPDVRVHLNHPSQTLFHHRQLTEALVEPNRDSERMEYPSSNSRFKFLKNASSSIIDNAKASPTNCSSLTSIFPQVYSNTANKYPSPHQLTRSTTMLRRSIQGGNRISPRCPNLKIQAAAKLVSKYKLKRLSPTTAPTIAPLLYHGKAHYHKTAVLYQQEFDSPFIQKIKNKHKLDNRQVNSLPTITPKHILDNGQIVNNSPTHRFKHKLDIRVLTYKSPTHHLTSIKDRHKLDNRQITNNLPDPQSASNYHNLNHKLLTNPPAYSSLIAHKHKLDNRQTTKQKSNIGSISRKQIYNTEAKKHKSDRYKLLNESMTPTKNLHLLTRNKLTIDKRINGSEIGLDKLDSSKFNTVYLPEKSIKYKFVQLKASPRQAIKHPWVSNKDAVYSFGRKGSRPVKFSSKFKWKSTNMQPGTTPQTEVHNSRFKWSRPSVQAKNGAWQQLRQKLQLMLNKKYRHSRFKFSRYPSLATTPSNHNRAFKVVDSKTNLVFIDGTIYKSSMRKLTRTRSSSQSLANTLPIHMTRSPAQLKSISNGPVIARRISATHSDTSIANIAHRAIHRSKVLTVARSKKNNRTKNETPHCIFFGRFGKCLRGDRCPYVHDPEKVTLCTRFLRGKCEIQNCPFSHKASLNKMPVCLFFLRGTCFRENCPYLHVRVNPNAPVCKDFRNGFCTLGEKCTKIHSHVCPSFAVTGRCSKAAACTMIHRMSKRDLEEQPSQAESLLNKYRKHSQVCVKMLSSDSQHLSSEISSFVPSTATLKIQPSFISLKSDSIPFSTEMLKTQSKFVSLESVPISTFTANKNPSTAVLQTQPSFISLEYDQNQSSATLKTQPSFISLESEQNPTTPLQTQPSFISLESSQNPSTTLQTQPSFISLESSQNPYTTTLQTQPTFISLESDQNPTTPLQTQPTFISLESSQNLSTPLQTQPTFISLESDQHPTTPLQTQPSFISLESSQNLSTTIQTQPSFISLESSQNPSTTTLKTQPSFISLASDTTPPFVALDKSDQERCETIEVHSDKPVQNQDLTGPFIMDIPQVNKDLARSIRPSFLTKRFTVDKKT